MKRDPEVIRAIALAVEELPPGQLLSEMEGLPQDVFVRHTELMLDAGLLVANIAPLLGATHCDIERLTWLGHDFAEACRSPGVWERAKKSVIAPGAAWTLDLLKEWLKAEIGKGFSSLG